MAKANNEKDVKETNVTDTQETTNGAVDMEALKAEMLAELKAEMAAEMKESLKEELRAEMQAEQEAVTGKVNSKPMTKEEIEYWDELVPYYSPWIDGEEEEITIGHNGKFYKIKRGEEVKIPRKILMVLQNSERQKRHFAAVKKELENQELQA